MNWRERLDKWLQCAKALSMDKVRDTAGAVRAREPMPHLVGTRDERFVVEARELDALPQMFEEELAQPKLLSSGVVQLNQEVARMQEELTKVERERDVLKAKAEELEKRGRDPGLVSQLEYDLRHLINSRSREGKSNTPDYVLAAFMARCLEALEAAIQERTRHRGDEVTR